MELKDLIVTPIFFIIILIGAYLIRPYVTNDTNRKYFFPALVLKMTAAILLGFLYQFYYNGGDTFLYHTNGSAIIYEALLEEPLEGLKLLFSNGDWALLKYKYVSRIRYFGDPSSYVVVQIAAIFDLFTFATYSATALLFAVMSFSGSWCLYQFFLKKSNANPFLLALSVLFIPSVIFWSSGILKDSLTLAAVGWFMYALNKAVIEKRNIGSNWVLLVLSLYLLYMVKVYILLCLVPSLLLYLFMSYLKQIKPIVLRNILTPVMIVLAAFSGYLAVRNIVEEESKYSLQNIAQTAKITAYDIAYWTGKDAGSTYTLGELDGTFESMLRLAPEAVNVALFRPYLWEVKNVFMLLSAIESLLMFVLTLFILVRSRLWKLRVIYKNPLLMFCLIFSIVFAFGVGISTFNFGTLSRYRIPLLPFYLTAIVLLFDSIRKNNLYKPAVD